MNYDKSMNLLIIRFDKELLDEENDIINDLLTNEIIGEHAITYRLEEKYMLIIESTVASPLNVIYKLIEQFCEENGIQFRYILVKETILEFGENENTEEYLGKFVKTSDDTLDIIGVEVKFIYKSSTSPLFVHIEDDNENRIMIRIMDLSEEKDDFSECYTYMDKALKELIEM